MRNQPIWIALFSVIFRFRSYCFPLVLFSIPFSPIRSPSLSSRKFQFFTGSKMTFYVNMHCLKRCYWKFMTCDTQLMNTMIFMRCMHLNNERRMIIAFHYVYGLRSYKRIYRILLQSTFTHIHATLLIIIPNGIGWTHHPHPHAKPFCVTSVHANKFACVMSLCK